MKTSLLHIDNSFFRLTAQQARKFSVTGKRPSKPGYEVRANLDAMRNVKLTYIRGEETRTCAMQIKDAAEGWIMQTVVWGKPVWAVRLRFPIN